MVSPRNRRTRHQEWGAKCSKPRAAEIVPAWMVVMWTSGSGERESAKGTTSEIPGGGLLARRSVHLSHILSLYQILPRCSLLQGRKIYVNLDENGRTHVSRYSALSGCKVYPPALSI